MTDFITVFNKSILLKQLLFFRQYRSFLQQLAVLLKRSTTRGSCKTETLSCVLHRFVFNDIGMRLNWTVALIIVLYLWRVLCVYVCVSEVQLTLSDVLINETEWWCFEEWCYQYPVRVCICEVFIERWFYQCLSVSVFMCGSPLLLCVCTMRI